MTTVLTHTARNPQVRAMRIILGTTTKSQILEFCPQANVGVLYKDGVEHETDIRWIYIPGREGAIQTINSDGDWVVERSDGTYTVESDARFHDLYEAAE